MGHCDCDHKKPHTARGEGERNFSRSSALAPSVRCVEAALVAMLLTVLVHLSRLLAACPLCALHAGLSMRRRSLCRLPSAASNAASTTRDNSRGKTEPRQLTQMRGPCGNPHRSIPQHRNDTAPRRAEARPTLQPFFLSPNPSRSPSASPPPLLLARALHLLRPSLSFASAMSRSSTARSSRAGLNFPVGLVCRRLKLGSYSQRVGGGAPVRTHDHTVRFFRSGRAHGPPRSHLPRSAGARRAFPCRHLEQQTYLVVAAVHASTQAELGEQPRTHRSGRRIKMRSDG